MSIVDNSSDIRSRLAAAEAALVAIGQRNDPVIERLDIAVLIPAEENATTISEVVRGYRVALPSARIYVYDADSTDGTALMAKEAGAIVRREGSADAGDRIRHMFADVDADVYVLADASGAYDPTAAPRMISRLVERQADMVSGGRITPDKKAFEPTLKLEDAWTTSLISQLFKNPFNDMLTGYRVLSKRFVKSFTTPTRGLNAQADLVLHALDLAMTVSEVHTTYSLDPMPAPSQASIAADAWRALTTSARLMRNERPLLVFGLPGLGAGILASVSPSLTETVVLVGISVGLTLTGIVLNEIRRVGRQARREAFNLIESLASRLERLDDTRRRLEEIEASRLRPSALEMRPRSARIN